MDDNDLLDVSDHVDTAQFVDAEAKISALRGSGARKGKRFDQYDEAKSRREQFLRLYKADPTRTLRDVCDELGVSHSTYKSWRNRWPQFGHQVDAIRLLGQETDLNVGWTGGFAEFRLAYFGMASPWFHLEVIDAIENAEPGSITLILLPPEHGKTTLLEDYCSYKYATDASFRILYGSEKVDHCIKVGQRVKMRMESDGPYPAYVAQFGPFVPQTGDDRVGDRKMTQPWGEKKWSIFKKGSSDERDYSFAAVGITAAVAGTRCDRLLVDDVQSLRSLGLTKKIIGLLRQDWFSRPGTKGATVIVGTRVGEDDVYGELMDLTRPDGSPLIDRIIIYPAVRTDLKTGEKIYLWPERYSPAEYARMEGTVGPDAWSRNYQQQPRTSGETSFTEEILDGCKNPLRSWAMDPPKDAASIGISIDPALGGQNSLVAAAFGSKLTVLDTQGDYGLVRTEQIISVLGDFLARWANRGVPIGDVVIEENAYQKGLPNDERLKELQRQYGFHIRPHQTGGNKNDEILGITAMALSMIRQEIEFPASSDSITTERIGPLLAELLKWRPRVRGTKLKMDRVMALWFLWLLWRQRRPQSGGQGPAAFKGEGLPFTPMARPQSGLLVPTTFTRR